MKIRTLALACALGALPAMAQDAGTMATGADAGTMDSAQSDNPHSTTNRNKKKKVHDKGAARAGEKDNPHSTDNPKRPPEGTNRPADVERAESGNPHNPQSGHADAGQ